MYSYLHHTRLFSQTVSIMANANRYSFLTSPLTGSALIIAMTTLTLLLTPSFSQANTLSEENLALASDSESCDVERGKKLYNKCRACHSLTPKTHLMGPSLAGIYGRKIGAAEVYNYSSAMKNTNKIWNSETLHAFLKNPMQYIPGNAMPFGGIKADADRNNLICFLKNAK